MSVPYLTNAPAVRRLNPSTDGVAGVCYQGNGCGQCGCPGILPPCRSGSRHEPSNSAVPRSAARRIHGVQTHESGITALCKVIWGPACLPMRWSMLEGCARRSACSAHLAKVVPPLSPRRRMCVGHRFPSTMPRSVPWLPAACQCPGMFVYTMWCNIQAHTAMACGLLRCVSRRHGPKARGGPWEGCRHNIQWRCSIGGFQSVEHESPEAWNVHFLCRSTVHRELKTVPAPVTCKFSAGPPSLPPPSTHTHTHGLPSWEHAGPSSLPTHHADMHVGWTARRPTDVGHCLSRTQLAVRLHVHPPKPRLHGTGWWGAVGSSSLAPAHKSVSREQYRSCNRLRPLSNTPGTGSCR